jgi:hypothetical protein
MGVTDPLLGPLSSKLLSPELLIVPLVKICKPAFGERRHCSSRDAGRKAFRQLGGVPYPPMLHESL